MERIQETAKEKFVKANFARDGVASAFLYRAICDLPDGLVKSFATRQLALWINSNTLFPIDLSLHGVNHQPRGIYVDELNFQKRLTSPDLRRFFSTNIRVAPMREGLSVNHVDNLDFTDMGHGRDEYLDWAWEEFGRLSNAKKGGLIVTLHGLRGQTFLSDVSILARGFPDLKKHTRRELKRGAEEADIILTDKAGWGYVLGECIDEFTIKQKIAKDILRYGLLDPEPERCIEGMKVRFYKKNLRHPFYGNWDSLYPSGPRTEYFLVSMVYEEKELNTILTKMEMVIFSQFVEYGYLDTQTISLSYKPVTIANISRHIPKLNTLLSLVTQDKVHIGNMASENVPGYFLNGSYRFRSILMSDVVSKKPDLFELIEAKIKGFDVLICYPKDYSCLPFSVRTSATGNPLPLIIIGDGKRSKVIDTGGSENNYSLKFLNLV